MEEGHHRENQGSVANGEREASLNNKEKRSCMCHICNKSFKSGKALGGHIRIHNLPKKQFHNSKQGTSAGKPKCNKWVLVRGNPTCSLCGKSFSSMKSLFGHMRSHPERVRRGIPYPNKTLNNGASSNSTSSSSTLSNDSAVDLSQALRGCWFVTAKRGRRSPSCSNANSGLEDNEIELTMLEAANELMLLASGNPKWEKELDNADQIEEKPLNNMRYEEVLNLKLPVLRKKMKLTELETSKKGNRLVVRCRICNTTFQNHQALEGHLCTSKNNQVIDESESSDVSAAKKEHHSEGTRTTMKVDKTGTILEGSAVEAVRGYQCKIFNKTFSTSQIFGDHMIPNWTGMAEAQSAPATSSVVETGQNCSKILSLDLNQIPAMDDEEGVQSDVFTPANIMVSSSYDSSTQNPVTNW